MIRYIGLFLLLFGLSAPLLGQQTASLARQYFSNGEYEKALELYEELYEQNKAQDFYFDRYLETLLRLRDYSKAERILRKRIRQYKSKVELNVDYGHVLELQGEDKKAAAAFEEAIEALEPQQTAVIKLASAFNNLSKWEYSARTYQKGNRIMREKNMFAFELGHIYLRQGKMEEMITSYLDALDYIPTRMTNVQGIFQSNLGKEELNLLEQQLYMRSQKSKNSTIYSEMLIWLFIQRSDFESALQQVRALDKRFNENGARVFNLARVAMREKAYDAAIAAYEYIIEEKGSRCPYYIDAKRSLLKAKRDRLTAGYAFSEAELLELEGNYLAFLEEFGRNSQTAPMVRELAELQAYHLRKIDEAIALLEEAIDYPNLHRFARAQTKLDLGDYYLMSGAIWDASLLYSQVDKDLGDAPLGETARYKNARLSYYNGDFEWAQAQLDILKGSTSELISNDAIELSVFIMEHLNLDTTAKPMALFARADLLRYQNEIEAAFEVMDSVALQFEGHGLLDDIYFAKAEVFIKKGDYPKAVSLLERIIEEYKEGILVDNALFTLGELYEQRLEQPDKAMAYYQQILFDHSASTFSVEARKRYRRLRGDDVQ